MTLSVQLKDRAQMRVNDEIVGGDYCVPAARRVVRHELVDMREVVRATNELCADAEVDAGEVW